MLVAISGVAACGGDDSSDGNSAQTTAQAAATTTAASATSTTATGSSGATATTTATTAAPTTAAAPTTMTKVKAAVPPTSTFAPIWMGVQKGFFAAEGIDLELDKDIVGPSINAAVASGNLQVGGTVWAALIPAAAQDLPLIGISNISVGGSTAADDDIAIVATADSGVKTAADLRGKQIAVPNVASLAAIEITEIGLAAGVNPDEYTLVQVDFPNMPAALRSGQVDVAYLSEPFLTLAQQDMDLTVLPEGTHSAIMPELPVGVLGANAGWAKDNPDLVAAIQRAMVAATTYASEHPDEVRASLPDQTGLDAAVANEVRLPEFVAKFDIAKVQQLADLMAEREIASKKLDMTEYSIPVP